MRETDKSRVAALIQYIGKQGFVLKHKRHTYDTPSGRYRVKTESEHSKDVPPRVTKDMIGNRENYPIYRTTYLPGPNGDRAFYIDSKVFKLGNGICKSS